MSTGNQWAAKCAAWAAELNADREGLPNGLNTVVADLVTQYGVFGVLNAVSIVAQPRVDAAMATVELAAVLAGTARKVCNEEDTDGPVSTDTLELLARDADYVTRRVAMARGATT